MTPTITEGYSILERGGIIGLLFLIVLALLYALNKQSEKAESKETRAKADEIQRREALNKELEKERETYGKIIDNKLGETSKDIKELKEDVKSSMRLVLEKIDKLLEYCIKKG